MEHDSVCDERNGCRSVRIRKTSPDRSQVCFLNIRPYLHESGSSNRRMKSSKKKAKQVTDKSNKLCWWKFHRCSPLMLRLHSTACSFQPVGQHPQNAAAASASLLRPEVIQYRIPITEFMAVNPTTGLRMRAFEANLLTYGDRSHRPYSLRIRVCYSCCCCCFFFVFSFSTGIGRIRTKQLRCRCRCCAVVARQCLWTCRGCWNAIWWMRGVSRSRLSRNRLDNASIEHVRNEQLTQVSNDCCGKKIDVRWSIYRSHLQLVAVGPQKDVQRRTGNACNRKTNVKFPLE